jgi:hypothetical protein
MAYGIEIRNEFSEKVVDFNRTLTIKEAGVTSTSAAIGLSTPGWVGPRTLELYTLVTGSNPPQIDALPHFMATGSANFVSNATKYPTPLVDESSLYFYQVGSTGLLHHSEHTLRAPWATDYGMFAVCLPADNTPLPYLRVDATPDTGLTGAYGMQLRDAAGNVTFDSRADFLSVSEVLFVPKATMQDILDNNTVVDLTLRTDVPDCYISTPNHTSFFLEITTGLYRHVKITQIADDTLRLSRHLHGPGFNNTSTTIGINNDLVIVVARNPFI